MSQLARGSCCESDHCWIYTLQEDIEISAPRDEETGKIETLEKIKAKLLRRRSSKREIQAFMEKREEFGFYSNVRELKKKYRLVGELHDGEHFGEYSCLLGQHRTSTIVSLEFSELYSLSRDDLMEVYKMWPELHKEFLHLSESPSCRILCMPSLV